MQEKSIAVRRAKKAARDAVKQRLTELDTDDGAA